LTGVPSWIDPKFAAAILIGILSPLMHQLAKSGWKRIQRRRRARAQRIFHARRCRCRPRSR
jgi:hypothetical protein